MVVETEFETTTRLNREYDRDAKRVRLVTNAAMVFAAALVFGALLKIA